MNSSSSTFSEHIHQNRCRLPAPPPLGGNEALFLDFDGTLVEIADAPGNIAVPNFLVPMLKRVSDALSGAVAIVSGRTLIEIDRFTERFAVAAVGVHGLEMRYGDVTYTQCDERIGSLPNVAEGLSKLMQRWPAVLVEMKGAALALHCRRTPTAEQDCMRLADAIALQAKGRLEVIQGKFVAEIKPRGRNKGSAIHALMHKEPFLGRHPVFVGDDEADESGFRAVSLLEGSTVSVGARWPTSAKYQLHSVSAVQEWLRRFAYGDLQCG